MLMLLGNRDIYTPFTEVILEVRLISPAVSDLNNYCKPRGVMKKKLAEALIQRESTLSSWALQIAHATLADRRPEGHLVVSDHFYTRNSLGEQMR